MSSFARTLRVFLSFSLAAVCLVFGAFALAGQNANRPVPAGVPVYEFVLHDSSFQGYYLTAPFRLNGTANTPISAMILDSKGYLVAYVPVDARNVLDFKFNAERQQYQFVKFQNPQKVQYLLMDTAFELVDSFSTINGILPDIHDFQISKNGTFLLAGASDTLLDLSAYLFNGTPGNANTNVVGFVVQEFDAGHQLLFQWNSNDHIHPSKAIDSYGYNAGSFDYCHGNSIEEDTDGNLLISFRNLDAVYKIDRQTGAILWELGGKNSTFTFLNDPGFSGQHDVRRLPNGNIAMFDNGNSAAQPKVSRAVEYQLDTLNRVATRVWEYQYVPHFFSSALGSHQTTADRRHLINYGLNFRPDPSFVLVDDNKSLLAELFFRDSFMSYRSALSDLLFSAVQRPAISCTQTGGVVTLSAPPGHARYAWSTGESTSSIEVQSTGAFQFWVDYGIGMLGSEPFVIEDLSMACPVSSVSDIELNGSRVVIGYYDLLGREVAAPTGPKSGGKIYLVRYADGRMRVLCW